MRGMPKFLQPLLKAVMPWRIDGEYNGVKVDIHSESRGGGKQSRTYIVMSAVYPEQLPFSFRAGREGTLAKIGKTLLGMQDVQTGDPDLDPKVRIVSDDEGGAVSVFRNPDASRAFLSLLESFPESVAHSDRVTYERENRKFSRDDIPRVLELLTAFARQVKSG